MRYPFRTLVLAPLGIGSASFFYLVRYPRAPKQGPPDAENELFKQSRGEYLSQLPTQTLFRSLFVHSFCTHPHLVDFSMKLMNARQGTSVPVLDSLIRHTFFAHFCGGETREEAVRLGKKLQVQGISPLLVYSKESSDSPEDIHRTEIEITKCIEATKALSRPVFVAIKLSGLSPDEELRFLERDIHSLVSKTSSHNTPRFNRETMAVLSRYADLIGRLQRLANVASKCDVELVLDAEVRFQGEIDSLPTSAILCSMLNSTGSHVWNTHQMIFKDSIQELDQWSGNNPIKLVRGAYLHQEPPDKVIQSKQEADNMYDNAVREIILNRTNAVMLATHNHCSVVKGCRLLAHLKPVYKTPRIISFAQLYGMGDDITYGLVHKMKTVSVPAGVRISVVKYIPYGGLNEVLPYLVRRAEENRGMLGGSMLEREALYFELKRRVLKLFGVGSNI